MSKLKIKHIMPIQDVVNHDYAIDCICQPSMQVSAGEIISIHHSGDRREDAERMGQINLLGWLTIELKF